MSFCQDNGWYLPRARLEHREFSIKATLSGSWGRKVLHELFLPSHLGKYELPFVLYFLSGGIRTVKDERSQFLQRKRPSQSWQLWCWWNLLQEAHKKPHIFHGVVEELRAHAGQFASTVWNFSKVLATVVCRRWVERKLQSLSSSFYQLHHIFCRWRQARNNSERSEGLLLFRSIVPLFLGRSSGGSSSN